MFKKTKNEDNSEAIPDSASVLAMARRALVVLEEQAAGYTALTTPVHLKIELEAKRQEVAELEERLGTDVLCNQSESQETAQTHAAVDYHVGATSSVITIIGNGNIVGDGNAISVRKPAAIGASVSGNSNGNTAENVWFSNVGLLRNPFQHLIAEDDKRLLEYLVQPEVLRPLERRIRGDDDMSRWIIFANRGCGKTALCYMIAQNNYLKKYRSKVLRVVCGLDALEEIVVRADDSLKSLSPIHYVKTLQELVFRSVRNIPEHHEFFTKFSSSYNLQKSYSLTSSAHQELKTLVKTVSQLGFRYLLCLVDQIDGVQIVEEQPGKMLQFLTPLMRLSRQAIPGIAFRYFLPSSLEPLMQGNPDTFRLDRYKVIHLKWTEEDLLSLVAQRLTVSSKHLLSAYTSLGQLCESGEGFGASIDQSLIHLAEGSPRATIWLANHLIQLHCQAENPPRFIQPATWEQVQTEWWTRGRNQLFGSLAQSEGFVLIGECIRFQGQEIVLSEKYDALLRCLINARGGLCPKEDLMRAGWPGDDPEGVTDGSLQEAMRRMKNELDEQDGDSRWVNTVRGRGYRLRKPKGIKQAIPDSKSGGGIS